MKKIMVTGGAGFIGRHLCKKLLEMGDEVICVDDLYTGNLKNIVEFRENDRFTFILHDVTIPIDLKVDQIYNLACPASPIHYQKDPVKTIRTSFDGALNCLELAKKCQATVLQASTSEVYGNPLVHPQTEDYWGNVNPTGIRSCYDEGKRAAETLFFDYYRQFGVDIRVVRIFNTYGPYMAINDGRVVSNFILQALKGEDITIYGDGNQTRSFCYVDDMVNGLIKMMNQTLDGFVGPVNLGNPVELSMKELAEKIIKLSSASSHLIYLALPLDDPERRKPDISLAKMKLDWSPIVPIDKGLEETICYFRKII